MLPINWLNHHKVPDVNVDIVQNIYKSYTIPTYFFVEKYFDSWDPKIHGPRKYLLSFHVDALIEEYGTNKNHQFATFWNGISKNMRSSYIGITEDRIPLSSSDSEIKYNEKKNIRAMFKTQMKIHFYLLKQKMMYYLKIVKNLPLY